MGALFAMGAFAVAGADGDGLAISISRIHEFSGVTNRVVLHGRIGPLIKQQYVLSDETGTILLTTGTDKKWQSGDYIRVTATTYPNKDDLHVLARSIQILEHIQTNCSPKVLSIAELATGQLDYRLVSVVGTVTDVFMDEIDPSYICLTLEANGHAVVLTERITPNTSPSARCRALRRLIDKEVGATGICCTDSRWNIPPCPYNIRIDPDTTLRELPASSRPQELRLPHRHKYDGTVIAVEGAQTFYLQSADGDRLKVHLAEESAVPAIGDSVSVSGFLRHLGYFSSLRNAIVTTSAAGTLPTCTPEETTPQEILYYNYKSIKDKKIKPQYEGRLIRLVGAVVNISNAETPDATVHLDCNGVVVPVKIGADEPPPVASRIAATGVCALTFDTEGQASGFARVTGFSLLTRGPDDIVILQLPPWWTPGRLLAVIAALVLIVVAVLVWNRALRALAYRRGKELAAEQLERAASDLRVGERTRLAVEIHDALSQNLTGVSLQLDAVQCFADDRPKMLRHLDLAVRTLKNCRDELRNCLWDLRNRALEEKDLDEAVRRTVSPFVGDAVLTVRFNVPRAEISDDTAHALMRIVRELATNAVRHGQAKTIHIAGTLDGDRLLFSVKDDGCGFDPATLPGLAKGHFGLAGIRERVARAGGSLSIDSVHGRGAKISVALKTA